MSVLNENYKNRFEVLFRYPTDYRDTDKFTITKDSGKSVVCDGATLNCPNGEIRTESFSNTPYIYTNTTTVTSNSISQGVASGYGAGQEIKPVMITFVVPNPKILLMGIDPIGLSTHISRENFEPLPNLYCKKTGDLCKIKNKAFCWENISYEVIINGANGLVKNSVLKCMEDMSVEITVIDNGQNPEIKNRDMYILLKNYGIGYDGIRHIKEYGGGGLRIVSGVTKIYTGVVTTGLSGGTTVVIFIDGVNDIVQGSRKVINHSVNWYSENETGEYGDFEVMEAGLILHQSIMGIDSEQAEANSKTVVKIYDKGDQMWGVFTIFYSPYNKISKVYDKETQTMMKIYDETSSGSNLVNTALGKNTPVKEITLANKITYSEGFKRALNDAKEFHKNNPSSYSLSNLSEAYKENLPFIQGSKLDLARTAGSKVVTGASRAYQIVGDREIYNAVIEDDFFYTIIGD